MTMDLLDLWGKAGAAERGHPALYHMIDVGMVALCDMEQRQESAWLDGLLAPFRGLAGDESRGLIAFLVALHDFGKLVPPFQFKRPDLYPQTETRPPQGCSADHGAASTYLLVELFCRRFEWGREPAMQLAIVLGGHHGRFRRLNGDWRAEAQRGSSRWQELRDEAIAKLHEVFLGESELPTVCESFSEAWLLSFAGWVSTMDWLGSMEEVFPYSPDMSEVQAYALQSRRRAAAALERVGWSIWQPDGRAKDFEELFPFQPRALQRAVLDESEVLNGGPFLGILEAPMGCGKTEVSLTLADRWIQALGLRGLYYALPTQATSNQMFGRVAAFLEGRCRDGQVQLHLLHGNRSFHEDYTRLPVPSSVEPEACGELQSVRAAEWFRGRKRGLLSPFAVGTIDQALLAVLQVRHHFVRLYALAGKVLVLDEVHAYDAYMTREIEQLLAWARELGTSVLLLSATLPSDRRRRFVEAFGGSAEPKALGYPAMTLVDERQTRSTPLPASATTAIALSRVEPEQTDVLREELLKGLGGGGCAAWICNTVDAAQETLQAFRRLREERSSDCELLLFHARMPLGQRLEVERRVLDRFSKERRAQPGAMLIATQVVEQSLDLDFDAMVTELCPVDLVLQRLGRLHRHARDTTARAFPTARLHWIAPGTGADGKLDFGPSGFVYDPYILLKSFAVLRDRIRVILPQDLRSLVERVYVDDDASIGLADEEARQLREAKQDWMARVERESGLADYRLLGLPGDYDLVNAEQLCEDDERVASTRLDDRPGVRVVCLYRHGERLCLDREGSIPAVTTRRPTVAEARTLVMAGVSLSRRAWVEHFRRQDTFPGWQRSPLLRSMAPAVFDSDGVLEAEPGRLILNSELGVVYD